MNKHQKSRFWKNEYLFFFHLLVANFLRFGQPAALFNWLC